MYRFDLGQHALGSQFHCTVQVYMKSFILDPVPIRMLCTPVALFWQGWSIELKLSHNTGSWERAKGKSLAPPPQLCVLLRERIG